MTFYRKRSGYHMVDGSGKRAWPWSASNNLAQSWSGRRSWPWAGSGTRTRSWSESWAQWARALSQSGAR
jgi:hypothetical protein